ncbi:uncharacterized protein AB9X84_015486 isoform 1-T2 [Acanthopagrus schlegelii]
MKIQILLLACAFVAAISAAPSADDSAKPKAINDEVKAEVPKPNLDAAEVKDEDSEDDEPNMDEDSEDDEPDMDEDSEDDEPNMDEDSEDDEPDMDEDSEGDEPEKDEDSKKDEPKKDEPENTMGPVPKFKSIPPTNN